MGKNGKKSGLSCAPAPVNKAAKCTASAQVFKAFLTNEINDVKVRTVLFSSVMHLTKSYFLTITPQYFKMSVILSFIYERLC